MRPDDRATLITELQRVLTDRLKVWGSIRTAPVEEAFRAVPRHLFIDRYYDGDRLVYVDPERPTERQLRRICSDDALVSHRRRKVPTSSTSQPGLVAGMLEQLRLEPGMNVLEIGAGTGWNAALIGHIVGPQGRVHAIDIQEDVARVAREHLSRAGASNVTVIAGDGGHGHANAAPFDRIVTTAACPELCPRWAQQLAAGGALLVTLRDMPGSTWCLNLLLHRRAQCLRGEVVGTSGFMALQGEFGTHAAQHEVGDRLERLTAGRKARTQPATWAYLGLPERSLRYLLGELALFCQLEGLHVELVGSRHAMVDPDTGDACVIDADGVEAFGGDGALERLRASTRRWIELGAPRRDCYRVEAWPPEVTKRAPGDGWLLRRRHTQLIFRLKERSRANTRPW